MVTERHAFTPSGAVVEALALALFTRGPLTRGELATVTRLSRPSVSGGVAELLASGRAEAVGDAEREVQTAGARGRPSQRIRLSRRRADVVGLEIGRGHVAVAIADATHDIVARDSEAADPRLTLSERADLATALVEAIAGRSGIDLSALRRVAVGLPGPRLGDTSAPAIDFSLARLERERAVVAEQVSSRLHSRVDVGNNTRYTALAEARRRVGRAAADLVYLRIDEGVGGGLVQDGRIAIGSWGAAGELGHVSCDPEGDRCPCGGRGCLELSASLPAVVTAAGASDAADLVAHADRPAYRSAILRAARSTARVLSGVLALTNPGVVVVGGQVADLPGFFPAVEAAARDAAPAWASLDLSIERADADRLLGAVGAAAAASLAASPTTDRKEHRA